MTSCTSCNRWLCDDCWRRTVDGAPWCELCIHYLTSVGGNVALAVGFFLTSTAFAVFAWNREAAHSTDRAWFFWIVFALLVCGVSLYLGTRRARHLPVRVAMRASANATGESRPPKRRGAVALRRASRVVASPVSGFWTSVVLIVTMSAVLVAVPRALRLPRWIEAESVVFAWWLLWSATLTTLLYRGWRLAHDHVLAPPRAPWSEDAQPRDRSGPAANTACSVFDVFTCGEAGFAVALLGAILALVWLVVELIVPALFFVAYLLTRTSLARVANDQHQCERHLGRALGWGMFWASAYAVPLAMAIAIAHHLLRRG